MATIRFDEAIKLRQISKDVFQNIQKPFRWAAGNVPGSILMALSVNAAYQTVSDDFQANSLHAQFLSGPKQEPAYEIEVQRLSDGGRFATRVVTLKQRGATMVHVTCSFVRVSAMKGPSMQHSVARAGQRTVREITLDDLEPQRAYLGPWMRFQRLPLEYTGPGESPANPAPETISYTSVAQITPAITNNDRRIHSLGIIALSDYHVLDCPPHVHGPSVGQPAIDDYSQRYIEPAFNFLTSMSHSIIFHIHDGFRADELCYIEAVSPWTANRRGEIQSRIFREDGSLIATCKQEAYYVLKEEPSKL